MELVYLSLGDNLGDPSTGDHPTDAEKHERLIEQAVAAEAAGFDSFWVGEHHFCDYVTSQPAVVLSAIAQHTKTIRLGTGVTLLPTLDPVLVAEEFATLDAMSKGRAEITVGRGIDHDVYTYMGRSIDDVDSIFPESIELLHRLLTEEKVTWEGRWRAPLDNVTIRPRPVQQPIPIWAGTSSVMELAARLGLPTMWVAVQGYEHLIPAAEINRQFWVDAGRSLDEMKFGISGHFHVGKNSQEAKQRFAPHRLQYGNWVQSLHLPHFMRHSVMSDLEGQTKKILAELGPNATPEQMLDFGAGPFCGSPAEVVDKIKIAQEKLGFNSFTMQVDMGGTPHSMVMEEIELIATEVIPALKTA